MVAVTPKAELLQIRIEEKKRTLVRRDAVDELIDAMCGKFAAPPFSLSQNRPQALEWCVRSPDEGNDCLTSQCNPGIRLDALRARR